MDSRAQNMGSVPQRGTGMLHTCLQNYNMCLRQLKNPEKDMPESFDTKASMFSYKNSEQRNVLITKSPSPTSASSNVSQDKDNWYSAKSNKSIPVSCGVYYFEVKVASFGQSGGQFVIGIGSQRSSVTRNAPGLDNESYGLHVRTGTLHLCGVQHPLVAPSPPQDGIVYGCGVNFLEDEIFFTCDGQLLGKKRQLNLIRDSTKSQRNPRDASQWHPMIGMKNVDAELVCNFGPNFMFRLRSYLQQQQVVEQRRAQDHFAQQADNEREVRELVFQFLVQHGHCDTASALSHCSSLAATHDMVEEKRVMASRQQIGQHLHNSDFTTALALLARDWPQFPSLYPLLYFKILVLDFRSKVRAYLENQMETSVTTTTSPSSVSALYGGAECGVGVASAASSMHTTISTHTVPSPIVSSSPPPPAPLLTNGDIRQYTRMLQQHHFQRHPGTVAVVGDSSDGNETTTGGMQSSQTNHHFSNGSGDTATNFDNQDESTMEMEVEHQPTIQPTISHTKNHHTHPQVTAEHQKDANNDFQVLLRFGSELKLKSLELVEKRNMETEYYNLLEQLFHAFASGEMPTSLRSPSLPEAHLLRSVDMALLACQRGTSNLPVVAPRITQELLQFEKHLLSGRMNTKQAMVVHLQQALVPVVSTPNIVESGVNW